MRRRHIIVVMLIAGGALVPPASFELRQWAAADDPARLAALRLPAALPRLDAALEAALTAEDLELARSLAAVAAAEGVAVAPAQLDALAALEGDPTRGVRSFARGFLNGDAPGGAGAAGTLSADVVGYGDLRDLFWESRKVAQGLDPDPVTVSLAAAGLALTGATWASLGGVLPARSGLSVFKAAHRTGALSPALRASMARPAVLRGLTADVGTLYARSGAGGVRQALAVAENADDLRRAARLAEARGPQARGILALLGRGALVMGGLTVTAMMWIVGAAFYLVALAAMAVRAGLWLRRARRRAVHTH